MSVCWKIEVLKKYIIPHANRHYYANNGRYVKNQFPKSRYGGFWCEQAGLIRRLQEKNMMPIAFPYVARAFHAGFYGKNRQGKHNKRMSYLQMLDFLRKTVFNVKELAKYVYKPEHLRDSMPCNLKLPAYKELKFITQVN